MRLVLHLYYALPGILIKKSSIERMKEEKGGGK